MKVCRAGHLNPPFRRYASPGGKHLDNDRPFCVAEIPPCGTWGSNDCGSDLFHGHPGRVLAYAASVLLRGGLDPRPFGLALVKK